MPRIFDTDEDLLAFARQDATVEAQSLRDYTQDPDVLKNGDFLADLRQFFQERDGDTFSDDGELIDRFLNDRRWSEFNTVGAGIDLYQASNMTDDQKARMARIQQVYDTMPAFWEEGGGSVSGAIKDLGGAMLADPLNLIGFGAGGKVAGAAAAQAMKAGKSGLAAGAKAAATKGAIYEGAANAGIEGIVDVTTQNRNMEIGLQDEYSAGQTALSMGAGAVLGGAMGAGFGALAALKPAKLLQELRVAQDAGDVEKAREIRKILINKKVIGDADNTPDVRSEGVKAAEAETVEADRVKAERQNAAQDRLDAAAEGTASDEPIIVSGEVAFSEYEERIKVAIGELEANAALLRGRLGAGEDVADELASVSGKLETAVDGLSRLQGTRGTANDVAKLQEKLDSGNVFGVDARAKIYKEIEQAESAVRLLGMEEANMADAINKIDEFLGTPLADEVTPPTTAGVEPPPVSAADPKTAPPKPAEPSPEIREAIDAERAAQTEEVAEEVVEEVAPTYDYDGVTTKGKLAEIIRQIASDAGSTMSKRAATRLARTLSEGKSKAELADVARTAKEVSSITEALYPAAEALYDLPLNADQSHIDGILDASGLNSIEVAALRHRHKYEAGLIDEADWQEMASVFAQSMHPEARPGTKDALLNFLMQPRRSDEAPIHQLPKAAQPKEKKPSARQKETINAANRVKKLLAAEGVGDQIMEDAIGRVWHKAKFYDNWMADALKNDGLRADRFQNAVEEIITNSIERHRAGQVARGGTLGRVADGADGADGATALEATAGKSYERYTDPKTGEIKFREKTQGILKGERVNKDGQVILDRQTYADISAAEAGLDTNPNAGLQETIAPKRIKTADAGPVKKGTKVYYDAQTKKYWADPAKAVSGRIKSRTAAEIVGPDGGIKEPAVEAPASPEIDLDALQTKAMKKFAADQDYEAFRDAIEAIEAMRKGAPAKTDAPAAKTEAPAAKAEVTEPGTYVLPEGRKWAIFSKTEINKKTRKPHQRIASAKQVAEGTSPEDIRGALDPEDAVIGTVDINANAVTARDSFVPYEEAIPEDAPTFEPPFKAEDIPNVDNNKLPLFDDIADDVILVDGEEMTVRAASLEAAEIDSTPWSKLQDFSEFEAIRQRVAALYKAMPEYRMPADTRRQAVTSLSNMLNPFDNDTLTAAQDFLRRLSSDAAPIFEPSIKENLNGVPLSGKIPYYNTQDNIVRLTNLENLPTDADWAPEISIIHHETAHWAYQNILSNEDRLQFWDHFATLYNADGKLNQKHIFGIDPMDGAAVNPQELFAILFQKYMSNPERTPGIETLWKKVAKIITRTIDMFRGRATGFEEKIDPLFAKIVSDDKVSEVIKKRGYSNSTPYKAKNVGNVGKTKTNFTRSIMEMEEIDDAIRSGNPDRLRYMLRDQAKNLYVMGRLWRGKVRARVRDGKTTKLVPHYATYRAYRMGQELSAWANGELLEQGGDGFADVMDISDRKLAESFPDEFANSRNSADQAELEEMIANQDNPDYWDALEAPEQVVTSDGEVLDGFNVDMRSSSDLEDYMGRVTDPDEAEILELTDMALKAYDAWADLSNAFDTMHRNQTGEGVLFDPLLNRQSMGLKKRNILKANAKKAAKEQAPKEKMKKEAKKKAAKKKERVEAQAVAKAKDGQSKKSKKTKTKTNNDAPTTARQNVRDMSKAELALEIMKEGTASKRGKTLGREIIRRTKTETVELSKPKGFPKGVTLETTKAVEKGLLEALANSDAKNIAIYGYELQQRNKALDIDAITNLYLPAIKAAVVRERKHNMGQSYDDGIPASAPVSFKELIRPMTHRDLGMQRDLRTMTYRMLNLLGSDARRAIDEADVAGIAEVYQMAGVKPSSLPTGLTHFYKNPVYVGFRGKMRKAVVGLNSGQSSPFDVMHEVTHLTQRAALSDDQIADIVELYRAAKDPIKERNDKVYNNHYDNISEEALAMEWHAEMATKYFSERVSKGDILSALNANDTTTLLLRGRLDRTLDTLQEATSYVVNGVIGRDDIKQQFRRMTWYGDMFAKTGSAAKLTATGTAPARLVQRVVSDHWKSHSQEVKDVIRDFHTEWNADGSPVGYYHGTPSLGQMRGPNTVMRPSQNGLYGEGIYVTRSEAVAHDVYAGRSTQGGIDNMLAEIGENISNENDRFAFDEMTNELEFVVGEIQHTHGLIDHQKSMLEWGLEPKPKVEEKIAQYERRLISLEQDRTAMENGLKDAFGYEAGVLPLYVRAENPLDLTADVNLTEEYDRFAPIFGSIVDSLEEAGFDFSYERSVFGTEEGQEIFSVAMDKTYEAQSRGDNPLIQSDMAIDPAKFFQMMIRTTERLMDDPSGNSADEAAAFVRQAISDNGYDSLRTIHSNTLDNGQTIEHEALVLFTPNQTKHIEADQFDKTSPYLYRREVAGAYPQRLSGNFIEGALQSKGDFDPSNAGEVMKSLEDMHIHPLVLDTIRGITRRDPEAASGLNEQMGLQIGANSERARKYSNAHSFADWAQPKDGTGHHERHASGLGGKMYPLFKKLNDLPDAFGTVRRWANNNRGLTLRKPKQPDSHARIMKALRRPANEWEALGLSDAEADIAGDIREAFKREHEALNKAGYTIGYVDNYAPQIWDAELIQKNRDEFASGITEYLLREANDNMRQGGGTPLARPQAEARAKGIIENILEENGVLTQPGGGSTTPRADHLDYHRVLNFTSEDLDALGLERFMENDLTGILSKYFDGSTRKLDFSQKFGVNNHGFADYMKVRSEGIDAAVDLMSTKKVYRQSIHPRSDRNQAYTEMEIMAPAAKAEVQIAISEGLQEARGLSGRVARIEAVKRKIMEKQPHRGPDATEIERGTYAKRADAVASALIEGMDEGLESFTPIANKEARFMQAYMNGLMNKPVTGSYDPATGFTKKLRNFNSVTLLSYTMLTSLTDVVLPLIRSGNMKAWTKGMYKYARDPQYREAIKNIGVGTENLVHDRMAAIHGTSGGLMTNAFFNFTGLSGWTRMQRDIAGLVGHEAFRTEIARARRLHRPGADWDGQSRDYKIAMRFLKRYGLDSYTEPGSGGFGDVVAMQGDDQVREAIIKFSNDTIFAPNQSDLPIWTQTPWGSLVFQLKSFPLMMGRLSYDVLKRAKEGDVVPLLYMGSIGPAFGAASLATKDVLQARGGEDERSIAARERRVTDIARDFGFDVGEGGTEDELAGWAAEGFLQLGGLGMLVELLYNVSAQTDNGQWGAQRAMSYTFGPSFGLTTDAFIVASGAVNAARGGDSNAPNRAGVRAAAGRLPFAGGNRAFREGATDAIAGPAAKKGGSSSGGWGKGWGGSWGNSW